MIKYNAITIANRFNSIISDSDTQQDLYYTADYINHKITILFQKEISEGKLPKIVRFTVNTSSHYLKVKEYYELDNKQLDILILHELEVIQRHYDYLGLNLIDEMGGNIELFTGIKSILDEIRQGTKDASSKTNLYFNEQFILRYLAHKGWIVIPDDVTIFHTQSNKVIASSYAIGKYFLTKFNNKIYFTYNGYKTLLDDLTKLNSIFELTMSS